MKCTVLFCIDGNFWQHVGASIASLLASNPLHTFDVHLASSTEMDPGELSQIDKIVAGSGNTLIPIVYKEAAQFEHLPVHSHLTSAMYLRLFMARFLDPAIDKVLYLDGDTIVCSDIGELWQIDLGDAYVGAAPEPYDFHHRGPLGFGPDDLYINSGVMLVNLKKWREDDVLSRFTEFAELHEKVLASPDQDIINGVFRGHILNIGYQWNWQALLPRFLPEELGLTREEFLALRVSPKIVHFTSLYKPWYHRWQPHYKGLYYDALAGTPWAGYVPPDKTLRNLPIAAVKILQRNLEWYFPAIARRLRHVRSG